MLSALARRGPALACLSLGTAGGALLLGDSAAKTEAAGSQAVPGFIRGGSRYDQATYEGRLRAIAEIIDPRTLLTSDAELERCQALLRQFDASGGELPPGADDEGMWNAQRTVDAVIHGPTGEKMLLPGRMSAFVPMNVPIAAGMLMHGPTSTAANIFWQWVNQSYNVLNNYTNRAGPEVEIVPLLQSYGLAVGAAVGIAIGAGRLMKARPSLAALGPFVPYLAVITAGTCNVSFTRLDEIKNGINVTDADGNELGRSVAAGRVAVLKTVTTRSMFLPIFPLLGPPVVMGLLTKANVVAPKTPASIVCELLAITTCMVVALPCALAILPQTMELDVASLEPEFQRLRDAKGEPITKVFAKKGL